MVLKAASKICEMALYSINIDVAPGLNVYTEVFQAGCMKVKQHVEYMDTREVTR